MGVLGWKSHSRRANLQPVRIMIALLPVILCACSTVGTTSIDLGRTPYNQAIQNTAEQQTLLNIVRVANSETPFFMDVSEVDAATTVGASISGGPSGLGATPNFKKHVSRNYRGSGWLHHGQRNVSRSANRSISTLTWPATNSSGLYAAQRGRLDGLIQLKLVARSGTNIRYRTVSTPGYLDYAAAVNAIIDLDRYGAIIIAATQSPKKKMIPIPNPRQSY